MVRVLFLTTRLPYPPHRGDQVRSWNLLRHLAPRHRLTVATVTLGRPDAAHVERVRALGVDVVTIPLSRLGTPWALLRGGVGPVPFQVRVFDRKRARRRLDALVGDGEFDLIHAQLARSGGLIPEGSRVVVDLIDALSVNMRRRAEHDRWPWSSLARSEANRLDRYEPELLSRVAAGVVVAAAERDAIGDPDLRVIPNGLDTDRFPYSSGPRDGEEVVFAGSLGYFPNIDAAHRLATEIMPALRLRIPGASLHLVGANPSRRVRRLAAMPGVRLSADVDDIAVPVAGAGVAIVPLRTGSGLQNKVLEAMAVGTPVVTTPGVAAAVDAEPGIHLMTGSEPGQLADAAARLLGDPKQAAEMAAAAHRFVEETFSWERSAADLDALWREVVRRPD